MKNMKVKEIYETYYSNIPKGTFEEICKGDPTTHFNENKLTKVGRYVKWLTKLYLNNNLLLEDISKANEYLSVFYNIRNHIKGVDIFSFDSITSGETPLFEYISKYVKPNNLNNESELLTNKYFIINKEAEILFEDDKWLVVYPKTKDASGFYGANSQWCTRNPNSFETYNTKGKLFIFILKDKVISDVSSKRHSDLEPQRRFQYHIQENQFMNMADNSNISDAVIKLAFNIAKNEIHSYYNQKFTYDTFYKIIKKKYGEIALEDGYNVIFKNNHFFRSAALSYLERHKCDYNTLLENFSTIPKEDKTIFLKLLCQQQEFLTSKTQTKTLFKYLLDYDYIDTNIIPKLVANNHLNIEDVNYILDTKNLSDNEIKSILTSFPEYINDYNIKHELKTIYIQLLQKYSTKEDSILYSSLEAYTFCKIRANIDVIGLFNTELSFLRESLKELLYSNVFTHKIRHDIYGVLYGWGGYRDYEDKETSLDGLLNYKLDTKISKNDLLCNYKSLLDKYTLSEDTIYIHMLFTYSSLISKSDDDLEKIKNILSTYYPYFYNIYSNMDNILKQYSNRDSSYMYHRSHLLNMKLHVFDKQIHEAAKNKKEPDMLDEITFGGDLADLMNVY